MKKEKLEKVTVWTNVVTKDIKDEAKEALESGKAVRIGASCIGNTRAQSIANEAKKFFENIGAQLYEEDDCGECGFYYMNGGDFYTGNYKVGDTFTWRGHDVKVINVWNVEEKNGITIAPVEDYGFPIDTYEDEKLKAVIS